MGSLGGSVGGSLGVGSVAVLGSAEGDAVTVTVGEAPGSPSSSLVMPQPVTDPSSSTMRAVMTQVQARGRRFTRRIVPHPHAACGLSFDASRLRVHPVGMDETLPLNPLQALLPLDRPFTRAMARAAGVERTSLERMLREGTVRRLVRGVYAAATAPDTISLRAGAVALAVGREAIAVDRTAAWVHGVDVTVLPAEEPRPLEVLSPGRPDPRSPGQRSSARWP